MLKHSVLQKNEQKFHALDRCRSCPASPFRALNQILVSLRILSLVVGSLFPCASELSRGSLGPKQTERRFLGLELLGAGGTRLGFALLVTSLLMWRVSSTVISQLGRVTWDETRLHSSHAWVGRVAKQQPSRGSKGLGSIVEHAAHREYRDTGVDEKWVGYVITRPRLKERDHVTEVRTEIQSDLIPNTAKASLFSPRVGGSGQKLRTIYSRTCSRSR